MTRRHGKGSGWGAILLLLATLTALLYFAQQTHNAASDNPPPPDNTTPSRGYDLPPVTPADLDVVERRNIAIYSNVVPAVVSVANRAVYSDLFGLRSYEVPQGAGSGFVWDKQGHIVSNFHVVYQASSVTVTLRDGNSYRARIVGQDPDHDIAVLKIDAPSDTLKPVKPGSSQDLQVGQRVLAIGNPFGLDASLSLGIVSALGRSIQSMTGSSIYDVIQTDAAINPGNSGGPLLDSSGRLIGVNTAIISPSGGYDGVGFAVPVDTLRRIVPQLIERGHAQRAVMGVRFVPDHITREAGIQGVALLDVYGGSPAEKSGLRGLQRTWRGRVTFGDIILSINGTPVTLVDDLLAVLDPLAAGDAVALEVVRQGEQSRRVDVTLIGEQ